MGHGGVPLDHQGSLVRAFSKPTGMHLAIEVELLALVEGLAEATLLGVSYLLVEGNSIIILSVGIQ